MKLLIHDYEDELVRLAKDAVEIKVLIAFLTEGGLGWLPVDKAPKAEFIVGINLGVTSPDALKALQKQGADVRVFSEPGRMFHPKAVYFRSENDEVLIVGSNNLTSSGFSSNHEVSVSVRRDKWSESAFGDFLAHFCWLKSHACCGVPDEPFFERYKQTDIQRYLALQLRKQEMVPLRPEAALLPAVESLRISTLGDFIRLLARDFRDLDRRNGKQIKNHRLKLLNDGEFMPLFEEIVSKVSHGRLTGHSHLNVGGQWYRIPNIIAVNEDREPWESTYGRGRLVLQIHFSKDFSVVFLSAVLQYNIHRSVAAEQMPESAAQRLRKLLEHVENSSSRAKLNMPVFMHWNYKAVVLWGKPVMTFEHRTESLPDDEVLLADLAFLANVVNGASSIS